MKKCIFFLLFFVLFSLSGLYGQRTPEGTTVTTSGTVTQGCRKLTFIFSTNFTGTVLGVTYSGANDASISYDAPTGDIIKAVPYTVTAGNIRIIDIR